jgi:hypothetical protein
MSPTGTTSQLTKNLRISALIFVMVVALVTILGKGGGDAPANGGGGDTTAPTVSSTAPTDNSNDVARDATATATFSEAMDSDTIDTTSFSLRDGQGAIIPAAVSLDMNTNIATLMPNQFLNLLTPYTATLSTAIMDVAGNALAGAVNWSFRSEDGNWGVPELIEADNTGNARDPQIAFDPAGNALAVWAQWDGTRNDIWSNRYTAGSGWGALPELIGTGDFGNESSPQIAMDANGNALAVWAKDDAVCCRIFANRYTQGSGWGMPGEIPGMVGSASTPQIAIDANGNGIAVWAAGTMPSSIYSSRYTPGMGWDIMAELIKKDLMGGNASSPQIAINTNGDALAVWEQDDSMRDDIWSNRYSLGTGWGTEELIETDNAGDASRPQIAIDVSGNALAVWHQWDGTRNNVWSNRYTAGMGWGMAELIETENVDNTGDAQIAIDADGNALVVFAQGNGTRIDICSNRYTAGMGWGMAELIETDNADSVGDPGRPQIAIDANGNALAVWIQWGGTRNNIWSNRYTAGLGWGMAELIETENADAFAQEPQIAIDANGNALAIWTQDDGMVTNINANRLQ